MSEIKNGKEAVVFGIDITPPGGPHLAVVAMTGRSVESPEDPDVLYFETNDGLGLVFRDGKYAGWYSELPEPVN